LASGKLGKIFFFKFIKNSPYPFTPKHFENGKQKGTNISFFEEII